jgi:pimeloyl-ACP methyl ester carboxylesterase
MTERDYGKPLTRRRTLATAGAAVVVFLLACAAGAGEDQKATVVSKESAPMQRLSVGGAEIEYTDRGQGEPIFLVHAGGFADWFLPLSESPELAGFRVIRVRRAGYGAHSPERHLTLADHARHIGVLAAHLNISKLHYVGHSSSSLIGLELALDQPGLLESLVLIEPAAGGGFAVPAADALVRDYVGPGMAAFARGHLATAFETFMKGVCGENMRQIIQASLGEDGYQRAVQESAFFFRDEGPAVMESQFGPAEAERVTKPVLNIQGGAQPEHTVELARQITERTETLLPQTETVVIPGGSHALPLQVPDALGRVIAKFVRQHAG